MISVWFEDESSMSPFGPRDLLEELGIPAERVDHLTGDRIALVIAAPEHEAVTALSSKARSRTVLISVASDANLDLEAVREAQGFLGVVDHSAWRRWRAGMLVNEGLFGRQDVASAANLEVSEIGLQADDRAALPVLLGRFLLAAEKMLRSEHP